MTGPRRAGIASLLLGLALVVGVRLAPGLGGPPLYDGVVPVGPYLWLEPAAGQQGGAQGATAEIAVSGGQNGLVAVATPESLPQAQVEAVPGALDLPAGAATLSVSIAPVGAPALPADGVLASNVYRFDLVDQTGAAATAKASARVSIVLRSADPALVAGVVERFDGSSWVRVKTAPVVAQGTYLAVVTEFGDFAVVQPGAAASPPAGSGAVGSPRTPPSGTATTAPGANARGAVPSPGASAAASGGTGSAGSSLLLPIVGAAAVALLVFAVLVLGGRRSGPKPPSAPVYRGAHKVRRR